MFFDKKVVIKASIKRADKLLVKKKLIKYLLASTLCSLCLD